MKRRVKRLFERWTLPAPARAEQRRDSAGLPAEDPGTDRVLPAVMAWLCEAQDRTASRDGGVARDYSLVKGWASSYPETTGYIIPTMLAYAQRSGDASYRQRALRMADWLVAIQLPDGGFQGGKIDSKPVVPVTFNTGQILIGLAAAQAASGRYLEPLRRAARWLVRTQDADGCWRAHESPFAERGDKRYETHVAWSLFEAEKVDPGHGYAEAGMKNVRWALTGQRSNGWFADCCLTDPERPLTHTLGYALRGVIEAYHMRADPAILEAAQRCARGLAGALRADGFLPGRLASDWSAAADWACLTGTVQVAACWMLLDRISPQPAFARAAALANAYVRRTVHLHGPPAVRGGVKGSFPVNGNYGRFEFLNWAAKFAADSFMLESEAPPRAAASPDRAAALAHPPG